MAQHLTTGFEKNKGGRPAKHPWAEWFDEKFFGVTTVLTRSEDFPESTVDSFRVTIHRKAKKHGIKAETSIVNAETIHAIFRKE